MTLPTPYESIEYSLGSSEKFTHAESIETPVGVESSSSIEYLEQTLNLLLDINSRTTGEGIGILPCSELMKPFPRFGALQKIFLGFK